MADVYMGEEPQQKQESTADKVRLAMQQLGASGTRMSSGYIYEDYLPEMNGMQAARVFDKMRRTDSTIQAILFCVELPIMAASWFVKPWADKKGVVPPEAQAIADFIHTSLMKRQTTMWSDFLRQAIPLTFGFSVFEKVYEVDEDTGMIWLRKLGFRKQDSIERWTMSNGEPGIRQQVPAVSGAAGDDGKVGSIDIPWSKILLFSYRQEGENYQGISLLRPMYRNWYSKEKLLNFDNIRNERASLPIPKITMNATATQADYVQAAAIAKNMRANGQVGMIVPDTYQAEYADMRVKEAADLMTSIQYHDTAMLMAALTQFIQLGQAASGGGSRSLSEDQTNFFTMATIANAANIRDTINRDLIPEMVRMNWPDTEYMPELAFQNMRLLDDGKVYDLLERFIKVGGVSTTPEVEAWVRDQLSLPPKPEEAEDEMEDDMEEAQAGGDTDDNGDDMGEGEEEEDMLTEKVKASEHHDHQHPGADLPCVFQDEEYMAISSVFDWDMVRAVYSKARDIGGQEAVDEVKKKGLTTRQQFARWRPLTFAESKVNWESLENAHRRAAKMIAETVDPVIADMKADLIDQVRKAVENNDTAAIAMIAVKVKHKDALSAALTAVQKEMMEFGKKSAATEMKVEIPATSSETRGMLRVQNDVVTTTFTNRLEDATKGAVTDYISKEGEMATTATSAAVTVATAAVETAAVKGASALNTLSVTGSINFGRGAIFELHPQLIYAMQYSAILDGKTSNLCLSLDGRTVLPGSPEYRRYSPPQHPNCRSIWVEILKEEEFKPKVTGIPKSIPAAASVDSPGKLRTPVLAKGSLAIRQLRKEIAQRQKKVDELAKSGKNEYRRKQHEKRIAELKKALEKAGEEFAEMVARTLLAE